MEGVNLETISFLPEGEILKHNLENIMEEENNNDGRTSKDIFMDFIKNNNPVQVKSNVTEGWVDLVYRNCVIITYPQQGSPTRSAVFNFSMLVIGQSIIRVFHDKETTSEILEILDRKAFKLLLKGI